MFFNQNVILFEKVTSKLRMMVQWYIYVLYMLYVYVYVYVICLSYMFLYKNIKFIIMYYLLKYTYIYKYVKNKGCSPHIKARK